MIRLTFLHLVVVTALLAPAPGSAASRIDHEAETTWRQLTWEDFRGKIRRGQQVAGVATTIVVELGGASVEENEEGGWTARPVALTIYALMNKLQSGVRTGGKSDATLVHEQIHFDIAEINARRLHAELASVEGTGPTRESAQARLRQNIATAHATRMNAFNRMQAQYDGETAHGTRRKLQKKWESNASAMLEAEAPYPLR